MKKLITCAVAAAAFAAAVVGCKSVPTDSQMYTTSYAIGVSSGLVANSLKIDDVSHNAVIDIMNQVEMCVPETNQTFAAAWSPIAISHISRLVADGKITKEQGELIAKAFNVALDGVDYLFNIRFPKARQYQELVEAATHGFCNGFLAVFKPVNALGAANIEYDARAYEYLKAKASK